MVAQRYEWTKCHCVVCLKMVNFRDFLSGSAIKNLPSNAGNTGLISGLGRFRMPQDN